MVSSFALNDPHAKEVRLTPMQAAILNAGGPNTPRVALLPAGQVFPDEMPPQVPRAFCPFMMSARWNAFRELYTSGAPEDARMEPRSVASFKATAEVVDNIGQCYPDRCCYEACPSARGGMGESPQEELLRLREKTRAIREQWIKLCEFLGCVSCKHADRANVGREWPCLLDTPVDVDEQGCKQMLARQPGE